MEMGWLESILFGLISGLTELLPVSAQAHEALFVKLFGVSVGMLPRLLIHLAVLLALYQNCAGEIGQILREQRLMRTPRSRRKRQPDRIKILDLRLLRSAALVMTLGFFAEPFLPEWCRNLQFTASALVINGLILYIPMHMATGNKDSRSMSRLDAVLVGLAGALAVIPGISRLGILTSAGIVRGADRERSLGWGLLLCIPALVILLGFDVFGILTGGIGAISVAVIGQALLGAAAAYGGALGAVRIMRFLAVRAGFSSFAYYCWGAALFSFIMYLTV